MHLQHTRRRVSRRDTFYGTHRAHSLQNRRAYVENGTELTPLQVDFRATQALHIRVGRTRPAVSLTERCSAGFGQASVTFDWFSDSYPQLAGSKIDQVLLTLGETHFQILQQHFERL